MDTAAAKSELPSADYISPDLAHIRLDAAFPQMVVGNPTNCQWPYLRREIPHNWYVDQRAPAIGFLSRDEAVLLYNLALQFRGRRALEIGCWLGWSTAHLSAAGVELDVIDPILGRGDVLPIIKQSLAAAGGRGQINLFAGVSPQAVEALAREHNRKWSLMFIDGDHDAPAPRIDSMACAAHAEPDAMIVFHDLASPQVAEGLAYLARQGWQTLVYQTMQIMGIAWRGNVTPVQHIPDPRVSWTLPQHLSGFAVSGVPKVSGEINVLCGFDDRYAPHFATMIASLFATCQNPQRIRIHVISNLLSGSIRAQLEHIHARYGAGKIQWLVADIAPFRDAPLSYHFTHATYARIVAFNNFPAEKVVYLDVDLICLADISELHDCHLQGNPLGAILDPMGSFNCDQHKINLGIPTNALCFNGGVLVVDLARWRNERRTEACLNYLQRKRPAIHWVDQDILNGVFAENWLRLPSAWNVQSHYWKPEFRDCLSALNPSEADVIHSPKIVHFTDPQKPWHFGFQHPYREKYLEHLAASGWPHTISDANPEGKSDFIIRFDY